MESLIHVVNKQVVLTITSEDVFTDETIEINYILDLNENEELVITLDGVVQNNKEFLDQDAIDYLTEQTRALKINTILAGVLFK